LNVRDPFKRRSGFRSSLRIDRLTVLRAIPAIRMPENVGRNTQQFLKSTPSHCQNQPWGWWSRV